MCPTVNGTPLVNFAPLGHDYYIYVRGIELTTKQVPDLIDLTDKIMKPIA